MATVKYKLFFSWNFDKEELWLNKMSRQGLQLEKVGVVRYEFDTDRTKRYRYRLEPPADADGTGHGELEADPSLDLVCTSNGWGYYRQETGLDEPDPQADVDLKIEQYSRLLAIFGILTLNAGALLLNSLYTLFDLYIVNLVVATVLGLTSLAAAIAFIQVYWKVTRLKKEKGARR